MTHVETPLDPVETTLRSLEGKVQADRAVAFLRGEYPAAFGKARIRTYGGLGIRQTRWIMGRQQLTVEDVRAGRNFPDAVARTGWPIELHDTPQGYVWEPFGDDHLHYVPMGSLVSPACDNWSRRALHRRRRGGAVQRARDGAVHRDGSRGRACARSRGAGSVHHIDNAALRARVRDNVERTADAFRAANRAQLPIRRFYDLLNR